MNLPLDGEPLHARFVRLTHEQWEHAVQDLLLLPQPSGLSSGFAGDPPNGLFSNNERALFVSPTLWGDYQRVAETLAGQIAEDSNALQRVARGATDGPTFVREFGRRAYRRPLTELEQARYEELFASGRDLGEIGDDFADGVQLVLEAMLQSPHFVYRAELGPEGEPLSGYEIATKLSFFLRNTTPDDALLAAAASGELDTPEGVLALANTMLDEDAALAVFERFHAELLGTDRYRSIDKDSTLFPGYTPALNNELLTADTLFFDYLFANDLGLRDLLLSDVAFVSASTAGFYGVSAFGPSLTEVQLGPERPGFFTRIGFLALNGTLRDPDPIHRGVDLNRRVLCSQLGPPAGDIPPLPTTQPGQTNRQRVEAHTGFGTCGEACHGRIINPVGYAFENFDALGVLRTTDNGQPVDTASEFLFPDGLKSFANAPEFLGLVAESPQAHACYAAHVAQFALGRDLEAKDRAIANDLQAISVGQSGSLRQMVLTVIESPDFSTRKGG